MDLPMDLMLTVDPLPHRVLRPRLHRTSEDEVAEEEVGVGLEVVSDHRPAVIPMVQYEEGIIMFLPLLHRLSLVHQWTDLNLTMRCFDQGTDRHRTTTMPSQRWTLAYQLSDDNHELPDLEPDPDPHPHPHPDKDKDMGQDQTLAVTLTTMYMDKQVIMPLPKVMGMRMDMATGTDKSTGLGLAMGILRIGDLHLRNRPLWSFNDLNNELDIGISSLYRQVDNRNRQLTISSDRAGAVIAFRRSAHRLPGLYPTDSRTSPFTVDSETETPLGSFNEYRSGVCGIAVRYTLTPIPRITDCLDRAE